jgi:alkylation response protein AidB-like acyl-CoA dehydrogenase
VFLAVSENDVGAPLLLHDPLRAVLTETGWGSRVADVLSVMNQLQSESDNHYTSDVVAKTLEDVGCTRMWMSEAFGGSGASLAEGIAVVAALAEADASVGWQVGVQGAIGRISDYLPVASAGEIFGSSAGFVIGSVNPTGKYTSTDDGFIVTGRWSFASGERHGKWFVCAAVPDAESPKKDGIRMFFVPRERITVIDVWRTMGLRRTGSNDYSLDHVSVSSQMSVRQQDMFSVPPLRPECGYSISYYDFGPFTSAGTLLGLAKASIREFKSSSAARVRAASSAPISLSHTVQDAVGRAEISYIQAASSLLHAASIVSSSSSEFTSDALSAFVRLTAARVAEECLAVVSTMFRLAGTAAIYESSPLEQQFRDAHVASKHITLSPTNFEMAGQFLLGGPLQMRR